MGLQPEKNIKQNYVRCVFRKKLGPFFPKKEAQAARFKKRLPTWDNLTFAAKL